ncbi:MAG: peroxiredoxin [Verrucomicrobiota bacterium]
MKTMIMLAALFTLFGMRAEAAPLEIGARIPDVTGIDQSGKAVSFKEVASTGYVLVYFYPKADTPGCTAQACSLRDAYVQLQEKGVRVFGVSADKPESQKKFQDKYHLPFELIADSDGKVIEAFGVPRIPLVGFATRQAYLFKDGTLVWRDLKAATREQAADVLKVLNSAKSVSAAVSLE